VPIDYSSQLWARSMNAPTSRGRQRSLQRKLFVLSTITVALTALFCAREYGQLNVGVLSKLVATVLYPASTRCTSITIPVASKVLSVASKPHLDCRIPMNAGSVENFKNHCSLTYNGHVFADQRPGPRNETANTSTLRLGTCAVVSNSFSLLSSGCGRSIDMHDAIFRINLPPTEGFEQDVGVKTSFQTVNSHIARKLAHGQQEFDEHFLQEVCSMDASILLTHDEWPPDIPNRDEQIHTYLNTYCTVPSAGRAKAYLLSKSFTGSGVRQYQHRDAAVTSLFTALQVSNNRSMIKMPTSGFTTALVALTICAQVTFYGFAQSLSGPGYYYGPYDSTWSADGFHDIEIEQAFLRTLNQSRIFQSNKISPQADDANGASTDKTRHSLSAVDRSRKINFSSSIFPLTHDAPATDKPELNSGRHEPTIEP